MEFTLQRWVRLNWEYHVSLLLLLLLLLFSVTVITITISIITIISSMFINATYCVLGKVEGCES